MQADFEHTYRSELAYVVHSLRRLGVDDALVEDAAHDVFLAVHARWRDYDRRRPVRPWLFAFAARVASNLRGRQARRVGEPVSEYVLDAGASPEDLSNASSQQRLVHRALNHVDDDKRPVFVLHELDQVPVPEAAAALGLNTDTAWSRLRAARTQFNEACLTLLGSLEVPHV